MYKVTQEHIEKGNVNDPRSCPVALCLKNHFNWNLLVSTTDVITAHPFNEYGAKNHVTSYAMAPDLTKWIEDFDNGNEVEPVELEIICDQVHIKGEDHV